MGKKPVWQAYNTLITLRTTRYIWHISYICCDLFLHYVNNSFKGVLQACLMFIPKLIKRDLVRIQGCFFTPQEKTSLLKLTLQWLKNPFLWVQNKLSLNKMQLSFKQNLLDCLNVHSFLLQCHTHFKIFQTLNKIEVHLHENYIVLSCCISTVIAGVDMFQSTSNKKTFP